ncbi:hypothetical protein LOC71_15740 [Rhodopirellula sp. JC740]|uniref:Uncharacterized protein n=1 Tax=Rhodopirellula halodulae TaxID=2894198 RepID=A0ABS8NLQ8_9BACT|nr:hypothetical protein [Rhodopirellula sp. JC740]MCC9643738.1 hypothetical protein [Rhodopirellula sp. JC740]
MMSLTGTFQPLQKEIWEGMNTQNNEPDEQCQPLTARLKHSGKKNDLPRAVGPHLAGMPLPLRATPAEWRGDQRRIPPYESAA